MRKQRPEIDPRGAAVRDALRVVGLGLAATGAVLTAIGLVSFFSAFGGSGPPRYFWCAIVGLPVFGVGLQVSGLGFLGAWMRYAAGQTAPVQRDTFNYLAEATHQGVRTVAGAAAQGFATVATGATDARACPSCQAATAPEARFCAHCGASLALRICPRCRHENDPSGRFCSQCGGQLA